MARLFFVDAVNRDSLIQFEHEHRGPRCVVRLRKFVSEFGGEFAGMVVRGVALFVVVVGRVHIGENRLAVDSLVKRLRSARAVGMFSRVLLVDFGFFFRAFFLTLPVAAELVVEEFVGGEVGLARVRSRYLMTFFMPSSSICSRM